MKCIILFLCISIILFSAVTGLLRSACNDIILNKIASLRGTKQSSKKTKTYPISTVFLFYTIKEYVHTFYLNRGICLC